MRLAAAALVAVLSLTALTGCISDHTIETVNVRNLQELDAELSKRRSAVHDLQARCRLRAEGLEHSGSLSGVITFEPGRFRMDAFKSGMVTLFVFTMAEDRFLINVVVDGKWVRGSVKGQEKKHPELIAAFAWLDERLEPGDERTLEDGNSERLEVVTRRAGKILRRTSYERNTLHAREISLFSDDGAQIAKVELSDYRAVKPPQAKPGPEAWIPWSTVVTGRTTEGKEYRVETTMSVAYLNEGIKEGAFAMEIPEGATVEEAN